MTQIVAVETELRPGFHCYVILKVPMAAADHWYNLFWSRSMLVNGETVEAESVTSDVHKFMTWIEGFCNSMLVALNCRRYNCPIHVNLCSPRCHYKILWLCKKLHWRYGSFPKSWILLTSISYKTFTYSIFCPQCHWRCF